MKKKNDAIIVSGIVIKELGNAKFTVEIEGDHRIEAHISGKMRQYYIKLVSGDKVTVELSPYDLTKGRIISRHKV